MTPWQECRCEGSIDCLGKLTLDKTLAIRVARLWVSSRQFRISVVFARCSSVPPPIALLLPISWLIEFRITASYVADRFGRKLGVTIGLVVLFVGTIIQVVPAVNSGMFLAGRFLVGLGYISLVRLSNTVLMDLFKVQHNPRICATSHHRARPSSTPREVDDHVQHFMVCWSHNRSLDGLWNNQVYIRGIMADPCRYASSHASHPVHWYMVLAGKPSLALCKKPPR